MYDFRATRPFTVVYCPEPEPAWLATQPNRTALNQTEPNRQFPAWRC